MSSTSIGLLDIDVFKSSILKRGINALGGNGRSNGASKKIFDTYHNMIDNTSKQFGGAVWSKSGDGCILTFPDVKSAVDAGMSLLDNIGKLNSDCRGELAGAVFFTRIGIHAGEPSLTGVAEGDRGKESHPDLDVVGKLQKHCPIGRLAISGEAYDLLSFRRPLFRPSSIQTGLSSVFVLAERLITLQELELFDGMEDSQLRTMPPFPFLSWAGVAPEDDLHLRSIPKLVEQPLLIILGESSERRGVLSAAATSDAVGIMEAMAAAKSNNDVRVAVDAWSDTADLVTERHTVLVGSGIVNAYAFAINSIMKHVAFVKSNKRIFSQIRANWNGSEMIIGTHADDEREAGFVSVSRSPFNPEKALIWVAGTNGMTTQAAALLLKDLVADPDPVLHDAGFDKGQNPISCIVVPETDPPDASLSINDYFRKWRIKRYDAIWGIDNKGRRLR